MSEKKSEDYTAVQKKICESSKINFYEVKNLNSKIISLIDSLKEKGVSWDMVKAQFEEFRDVEQNLDYCFKIFNLSNSPETKQKHQEKSLLDLFLYLLLVEGVFSKLVQIITCLLIENDHDLYDPKRMEFIKDYSKLDKVELFIKLQFIEIHGFNLLVNSVDRELRNCIAHIDIMVKEDGKLVNKRTGKNIDDFKQSISHLLDMITMVICVMDFAFKRKMQVRNPKSESPAP